MSAGHRQALASPEPGGHDFPSEPYKGLAYYDAVDRRLFTGRDSDVDVCVQRLTASETRVLMIHGHTGCGKSSFLRAGLIPELEGLGLGYLFLRDETGSPLFIRSGADPLGRLIERIYQFVATPVTVQSADGPRQFDLAEALLGHADLASFAKDCRQHNALRKSLQIISKALPCTLVIILDQMEEVITLYESGKPYRRQFFQFVKGFSTVNFSVKFVFALRKDYSGQFIELAQPNGAIDLRSRDEPDPAVPQDGMVKSDVKLYLLPELDHEKVRRAIELPTSREAAEGARSPFDVYQFSYAPEVVDQILADLFERSGAAVLPAMQIVCRELYQEARPKAAGAGRQITLAQYKESGDIAGPIDRHVSKSLRAAFGSQVKPGDLAREERKWREVLFKFVRLESDGTAHTREVEPATVAKFAHELGSTVDANAVMAYLTQPEVLLLRSVRSEVAGNGTSKLSLGHDFIAMVLYRWNAGRQARELARRLMRRVYVWTAVAVVSLCLIAIWTVLSKKAGHAATEYDVLINTTHSVWRQQPMAAMMTAAKATQISKDRVALFGARDTRADRLLSDLLASMPEAAPAVLTARVPGPVEAAPLRFDGNFPLARSNGFLTIRGDLATWSSATTSRPFAFQPLVAPGHAQTQVLSQVSELSSGKVVVLRTLIDAGQQRALLAYQLYVLDPDGSSRGPFGPDSFDEPAPSDKDASNAISRQMTLTGRFLVFATTKGAASDANAITNVLRVYRHDKDAVSNPFRRVAELDNRALGIGQGKDAAFSFVGDTLVVQSGFFGQSEIIARKFDLGAESPQAVDLLGKEAMSLCAGGCNWKWLSLILPDRATLVYGDPGSQRPAFGMDLWSPNSLADLGNYRAFMLIDVGSGRKFVVQSADIDTARSVCNPFMANEPGPVRKPPLAGTRAFVAQGTASGPLLGIVSGSSIDLLQVSASATGATLTCRKSVISQDSFDLWTATPDGKHLLGAGATAQARWDIASGAQPSGGVAVAPEDLRRLACSRGLSDAVKDAVANQWQDWKDLTHLTSTAASVCQ